MEERALALARSTVNAAEREVAAAVARLEALSASPALRAGDLPAFRAHVAATPIPELRRAGRGVLTVHGFRSSFRDWCAEATTHPCEVAEQALAHALPDKVEAAYRRGDMLESAAYSWSTGQPTAERRRLRMRKGRGSHRPHRGHLQAPLLRD